ncbi:hypothetical protein MITS9509_01093 [Synechococcus sp. MIT S9509]|nr:hypothetical protein MITS9504_00658 [Synechococcus sp. MIT S9504]KZR92644.1 hypothetical protein MITS9509_01093 [Synechococcus sp. MIT S9509]
MQYDPSASSVTIDYVVKTTGDVWFEANVGNSDSPNYSDETTKIAALAACANLSPNGAEFVAV